MFRLRKKGRFGRFPVSPYGKALSDTFWCRSRLLFCTQVSNSPVQFSFSKTPSRSTFLVDTSEAMTEDRCPYCHETGGKHACNCWAPEEYQRSRRGDVQSLRGREGSWVERCKREPNLSRKFKHPRGSNNFERGTKLAYPPLAESGPRVRLAHQLLAQLDTRRLKNI